MAVFLEFLLPREIENRTVKRDIHAATFFGKIAGSFFSLVELK